MTGSMWLYLILGIVCGLIAKIAQRTNKTLCVWLIVLCLTLIAGLRSINVGIDTKNYVQIFELVAAGNFDAIGGTERTFLYIVKALQIFSKSPTFLFVLFSLITNTLIVFRLWEFRKLTSFAWSFVYFYACFYFFTFNIMRQMVAVAIVFWGTRYVQKEKYIPYLLIVAVGALFHQSALLGLLYVVVDVILKKKLSWSYIWKDILKENRKLLIALICVAAVCVVFLLIKASKYLHYFTETTVNIGMLVPLKMLFVAAFVVMVRFTSGKWGGTKSTGISCFFNRHVVIYYSLGLLISLLGYFYPFMDRIGLYFSIFGCLFMGYVIKRAKHPLLVLVAYSVLILVPFGMDLVSGGQGQLPYAFFWQG